MSLILLLFSFLISTLMYWYLHKKTRMNIRFMFIDNVIVALVAFGLTILLFNITLYHLGFVLWLIISLVIQSVLIVGLGYVITMIRFWRTPTRKINPRANEIISPADGNVLYISHIEAKETPIAIKNGQLNVLDELTKTDLVSSPCWLIGINMTPWDVHKNCAPINGKILLNKHTKGVFLSLKKFEALIQNERNTYVLENKGLKIGVVQIASKGVRRIDTYVKLGDTVKAGDWLGMIRFGSQVDVILPHDCKIKIKTGQQIYAGISIIASF